MPHPARSPLELSQLRRGLLPTDCRGLVSFRCRPSGCSPSGLFPHNQRPTVSGRAALLTLRNDALVAVTCSRFPLARTLRACRRFFRRRERLTGCLATLSVRPTDSCPWRRASSGRNRHAASCVSRALPKPSTVRTSGSGVASAITERPKPFGRGQRDTDRRTTGRRRCPSTRSPASSRGRKRRLTEVSQSTPEQRRCYGYVPRDV